MKLSDINETFKNDKINVLVLIDLKGEPAPSWWWNKPGLELKGRISSLQ